MYDNGAAVVNKSSCCIYVGFVPIIGRIDTSMIYTTTAGAKQTMLETLQIDRFPSCHQVEIFLVQIASESLNSANCRILLYMKKVYMSIYAISLFIGTFFRDNYYIQAYNIQRSAKHFFNKSE